MNYLQIPLKLIICLQGPYVCLLPDIFLQPVCFHTQKNSAFAMTKAEFYRIHCIAMGTNELLPNHHGQLTQMKQEQALTFAHSSNIRQN